MFPASGFSVRQSQLNRNDIFLSHFPTPLKKKVVVEGAEFYRLSGFLSIRLRLAAMSLKVSKTAVRPTRPQRLEIKSNQMCSPLTRRSWIERDL